MTKEQILTFMSAGNAIFTIKSVRTGEHFTYKIRFAPQGLAKLAYLAVGHDEWMYVGVFTDAREWSPTGQPAGLRLTKGSHFTDTAPSVRALRWFLEHVDSPLVEFRHAGFCGRCGRLLTHPDSIDSGMGPECSRRGYAAPTLQERRANAAKVLARRHPLVNMLIQSQGGDVAAELMARHAVRELQADGYTVERFGEEILASKPVEQLPGDAHMMTRLPDPKHYLEVPVEQTDCSTAIDSAIESWKKR